MTEDKWEVNALADKLDISYYEAKAIYDNLDKIKEHLNGK